MTLRELAENLQVLHEFAAEWTNDDLISVFDEMIGLYESCTSNYVVLFLKKTLFFHKKGYWKFCGEGKVSHH